MRQLGSVCSVYGNIDTLHACGRRGHRRERGFGDTLVNYDMLHSHHLLHLHHLLHAVSQVHRFGQRFSSLPDMATIRACCWREEALAIDYRDRHGAASTRTIWPLAIVYLDGMLVVLARCCLREDFRMFRAERIAALAPTCASFRPRRAALLRDYQATLDATERRAYPMMAVFQA